jgi:uncharacterized protein
MLRSCLAVAALLLCACQNSPTTSAQTATQNLEQLQLTGRVVDLAEIIPRETEARIVERSAALEKETTDQLVILTVVGLQGRDIAEFSTDLANRWGVGQADKDNGVLLVVAPTERKVRIAVGYGLEGLLTDEHAATIISEMLPLFASNRHSDAISVGVQRIEHVLRSNLRRPQRKAAQLKEAA